jgi:hypothetical protein
VCDILFTIGPTISVVIGLIFFCSLRPTISILEYVEDGKNLAVVGHQGLAYHVSWRDQSLDDFECGAHNLLVPGVEGICHTRRALWNCTLHNILQLHLLHIMNVMNWMWLFCNIEKPLFHQHCLSHPHNLMWCSNYWFDLTSFP